jgi:hypothetical protein
MSKKVKNTMAVIVIVCTSLVSIMAININRKHHETKNKQSMHPSRGYAHAKTR